jgi:large subunit ribosomal protein L1
VTDSKAGKVEYRTDRQAIIHLAIGKASFDANKLLDNYSAVVDEIIRAKPSSAKGKYIVSCTLASTMGPGVRVDTAKSADADGAASVEASAESAEAPAAA